ncbi:hypothetical protein D9V29_00900 [Mycetocola manganoxydans]|uniref:LGFP repeat-containing protein n=1 Tax=Mycetocola manganoxydans TaxID=699879 RepID=A0A3L7A1J3_9MICO|nr:hypothetical protein [Mycetocola manganoxydans]RLP73888.1 hypothetical protein D9V29_00900 [Mycetocola manganoxydans]GHD42509.1 hypothetical protein GCM10008097_08540 [Mycetocola manganoxydans]
MPGVQSNTRARSIALFIIGLLVATIFVAAPLPASQTPSASAAGFNAGNIIDDAVFYNSNAMTEAGIQSFLNTKGASCKAGALCLKNYKVTTSNRAADAMCKAYSGASNETAARILYKVAQACGINPQVLLVMLEKEQSLVTMASPTQGRYNIAMGYGCPDFKLCDSQYFGLFNQVYKAGSQLIRYTNPPGTSNYFTWFGPGKTVPIQWHPNVSCGTGQVYVENKATASLYYYTPYQPNARALSAGWGTGDGCSAYGNRNFYNFFTSWFGSTRGTGVDASIAAYYDKNAGLLGAPLESAEIYADGGMGQRFTNYWVYRSPAGAVTKTTGRIGRDHAEAGGGGSDLGYPTGEYTKHSSGARSQSFQNGTYYWSSATGAIFTTGKMGAAHNEMGGADGSLGIPISTYQTIATVGRKQVFENGTMYWSPATGVRFVTGVIGREYHALGGPSGPLGFPAGDYRTAPNDGRSQVFENGTFYWSTGNGGHFMLSQFNEGYESQGGVTGPYGYPAGVATAYAGGGFGQALEAGAVYWSPSTGARLTTGVLGRLFTTLGGPNGVLGYPIGDYTHRADGGRSQAFQKGTIYWSPATGARYMLAEIGAGYAKLSGTGGDYGYPTQSTVSHEGGYSQQLQAGTAYWTSAAGTRLTTGKIASVYVGLGGPTGSLGYPTGDYVKNADGTRSQKFQNGTLFWSTARGVWRG